MTFINSFLKFLFYVFYSTDVIISIIINYIISRTNVP